MNYDLCKELADAGFPQDRNEGDMLGFCYCPTLEELIEACGEDFYVLELMPNGSWNGIGNQRKYEDPLSDRMICGGATPTEAVAKLWLALNSKKPLS